MLELIKPSIFLLKWLNLLQHIFKCSQGCLTWSQHANGCEFETQGTQIEQTYFFFTWPPHWGHLWLYQLLFLHTCVTFTCLSHVEPCSQKVLLIYGPVTGRVLNDCRLKERRFINSTVEPKEVLLAAKDPEALYSHTQQTPWGHM